MADVVVTPPGVSAGTTSADSPTTTSQEQSDWNDAKLLGEGADDTPPDDKAPDDEETQEIPPIDEAVDKTKQEAKPEDKPKVEEKVEDVEGPLDLPQFGEVNKKYPGFFKQFPQLRHAFFRIGEFNKIFPTVEMGKIAAAKADSFDFIETSVLDGDSGNLLDQIHASGADGPAAAAKFAKNFLPTLYTKSKALWGEVTEPLFTNLFKLMHEQGGKLKDDNLKNAALVAADFMNTDITKPETKPAGPSAREQELERRLQQAEVGRNSGFSSAVERNTRAELEAEIANGLDPEDALPDFMKKTIIKTSADEIDSQLGKDEQHLRYMNSLWTRARQGGLDPKQGDVLKSAYLARARRLIATTRAKLVQEALGKLSKTTSNKNKPRIERPAASEESKNKGHGKRYAGVKDDVAFLAED